MRVNQKWGEGISRIQIKKLINMLTNEITVTFYRSKVIAN